MTRRLSSSSGWKAAKLGRSRQSERKAVVAICRYCPADRIQETIDKRVK